MFNVDFCGSWLSLLCFKVWLPGKPSLSGCGGSTWSEQDKVTVAHAFNSGTLLYVVNGESIIITDSVEEAHWISQSSDGREGRAFSVFRLKDVEVSLLTPRSVPQCLAGVLAQSRRGLWHCCRVDGAPQTGQISLRPRFFIIPLCRFIFYDKHTSFYVTRTFIYCVTCI